MVCLVKGFGFLMYGIFCLLVVNLDDFKFVLIEFRVRLDCL